jgi:hypothetical protein
MLKSSVLCSSERYDILRGLDGVAGLPVVVKRLAQGADGDVSWPELLNEPGRVGTAFVPTEKQNPHHEQNGHVFPPTWCLGYCSRVGWVAGCLATQHHRTMLGYCVTQPCIYPSSFPR